MRKGIQTVIVAMITLILIMSFTACAMNPATGNKDFVLMSESREISLGRELHKQVLNHYQVYESQEIQDYVQKIGEGLASNSHRNDLIYRFTVLDTPDINAFALPGGYIYIHRGLLAHLNSEAQLAAVLAHEIGHVTARHSVRQYSQSTVTGLISGVVGAYTGQNVYSNLAGVLGTVYTRGYGRKNELEADRYGAQYLVATRFDPNAMIDVISLLKSQEQFSKQQTEKYGLVPQSYHGIFSTHPSNDKRLQEVILSANESATRIDGQNFSNVQASTDDQFLRRMKGMIFGDSERNGIRRANQFLHKGLNFSITYPKGWRIENSAQKVLAISPRNSTSIHLTVEDINKKIRPDQFLQQRLGLKIIRDTKLIQKDRVEGFSAIVETRSQEMRAAVLFYQQHAYVLLGVSKTRAIADDFDQAFLATVDSFDALNSSQVRLAKGLKIQLIKADRRSSFKAMAKNSPLPNDPENQLRMINGLYPRGEPANGQLVKVVR